MCSNSNVCDADLFLEISENKGYTVPVTCYISSDRANSIEFMKVTSNSTQCKKRKNAKHEFPKRIGRKCRLV